MVHRCVFVYLDTAVHVVAYGNKRMESKLFFTKYVDGTKVVD